VNLDLTVNLGRYHSSRKPQQPIVVAYAYTDGAIDQAWRAVQELTSSQKS
jgi:hypothetical protein